MKLASPALAAAVSVVALLSCAGGPGTAGSPEIPAASAQPADGGDGPSAKLRPEPASRDAFAMAVSGGPMELDPRMAYQADEAQLFTALYEGLFSYHPLTMEPVPGVAAAWELSDDKLAWTFKLRENARYWNGDTVLASHFRDAWLSLMAPEREAPYSSLFDLIAGARDFRAGKTTDPASVGIAAPDDRTLKITLETPASFFPAVLCHHSFAPVHPDMLARSDWSEGSPLSNGPFYIVETAADRWVLARNELYWDASRVAFKRIDVIRAAGPEEAARLWNEGEARWIAGDVDLDALTDRSGITVNAMFATHYYFIRSAEGPWKDARVRRALSLALPWTAVREGHLLPAPTLVFPVGGYPKIERPAEPDPAAAARLLEEAGYPAGAGMPPLKIRLTPSQDAARIAALMKAAWEGLGIAVEIDVVPFDAYFASLKKGDYVVGSSTWIGDFADPYSFLQMWTTDSNLNDARYADPAFDAALRASMALEGEERWKALADAETILLDGGPVLPISYTPAVNVVDTDELDGWFPNPLDIHPVKYLSYAAFRAMPGLAMASF